MSDVFAHLPLGKQTTYCDQYDASLLVAVPRAQTRDFWPEQRRLPFGGCDTWTGFELSWLNTRGQPQAACALIEYSALTANIVESKSLKLYLNSFNQTAFKDWQTAQATIVRDLAAIVNGNVEVKLLTAAQSDMLAITPWTDTCIDEQDISIDEYHCHADLLTTGHKIQEETLVSHLLRSNCPVTGQPDWASVRIHYRGPQIAHDSLLRYLCSYRLHQGFHEQCIEKIFCDLWQHCQPELLSIEGRFTRRGGLDINPFRSSDSTLQPTRMRQLRQ